MRHTYNSETELASKSKGKATRLKPIPKKDMTMMNCLERILEIVAGESLSAASIKRAQRYIQYVAERQKLNSMQTVLMALYINFSNDPCITLADIASELKCKNLKILCYQKEIDELEKKRILRKSGAHGPFDGYKINDGVMDALVANEPYVCKPRKASDLYELFSFVYNLLSLRKMEEIDTEELVVEINELYDENKEICFVDGLRKLILEDESVLLLSQMGRCLMNSNIKNVALDNFIYLFDEESVRARQLRALQNGSHELMKLGLIDFSMSNGFKDRGTFMLTDKARKILLDNVKIACYDEVNDEHTDILKPDAINEKQMIFDNTVSEQYDRLCGLLSDKNLNAVRQRLEEKNMSRGFSILFYGAPGTGKTEAVKQIARCTGREIMQINISRMRSMWVGQSEKNIKAVFDNYKEMCKRSERIPILLFNEADAIISSRIDNAKNSVDKMENSIQNIILQEMENFDGILIATTNLVTNFDKAFERRFLYKIEFTKPTEKARKKLWQTIMTTIDDSSAAFLAGKYQFSGGQIENVARKAVVDSILYGEDNVNLAKIEEYCKNEVIGKSNKVRIGF